MNLESVSSLPPLPCIPLPPLPSLSSSSHANVTTSSYWRFHPTGTRLCQAVPRRQLGNSGIRPRIYRKEEEPETFANIACLVSTGEWIAWPVERDCVTCWGGLRDVLTSWLPLAHSPQASVWGGMTSQNVLDPRPGSVAYPYSTHAQQEQAGLEESNQSGPEGNRRRGKKKRMQKVDPSILGFSVNAAERVNMGEIQTLEDSWTLFARLPTLFSQIHPPKGWWHRCKLVNQCRRLLAWTRGQRALGNCRMMTSPESSAKRTGYRRSISRCQIITLKRRKKTFTVLWVFCFARPPVTCEARNKALAERQILEIPWKFVYAGKGIILDAMCRKNGNRPDIFHNKWSQLFFAQFLGQVQPSCLPPPPWVAVCSCFKKRAAGPGLLPDQNGY